jgi:hypothetical protein
VGVSKVKTVGKIFRNIVFVFLYFQSFSYYSVNTVIDTKTGYGVAGIDWNTVGLLYRLFFNWAGKFCNFLDSRTVHLAFLHCSSGRVSYLFSFNSKCF